MLAKIKQTNWKSFFEIIEKESFFNEISKEIDLEYTNFTCFPPKNEIFAAFENCDYNNIKVVIIGQDPYHGEGEANGLCFSVNDGIKFPPSLKNIFTEINQEYDEIFMPTTGNLTHWASQGVLLLNATLTVRKDLPNSHKHLPWQQFTDAVIAYISANKENIVFLLWGSFAQKKGNKINPNKHLVLESGHPSPLSANRGFWFGNNHFKKTNEYLIVNNKTAINWTNLQ